MRRDDAGNQIKGNQPFGTRAFFVLGTVDGKGDADAPENHFGFGAARLHDLGGLLGQPALVALVMVTDAGCRCIHLIKHWSAHWLDLQQGSRIELL